MIVDGRKTKEMLVDRAILKIRHPLVTLSKW